MLCTTGRGDECRAPSSQNLTSAKGPTFRVRHGFTVCQGRCWETNETVVIKTHKPCPPGAPRAAGNTDTKQVSHQKHEAKYPLSSKGSSGRARLSYRFFSLYSLNYINNFYYILISQKKIGLDKILIHSWTIR